MIRHHPEVPAAVELADLAQYIAGHEFIFPNPLYENAWTWQSDESFEPNLRVLVPRNSNYQRKGSLVVREAVMVLVETSAEYELAIPIADAHLMDDDPYIEDFVQAFRQYPHGRSVLALNQTS
jgi:hypothetical protein